ncbi:MAG: nitrate/sulfonate/bicarbonate ABC transporter ATP-binding protein [Magnetovibrio sp.]|nr:nitrate/sulfonate/bicarbonate ABC transporter ATP-binding protein [Magnetovibrio sp.]
MVILNSKSKEEDLVLTVRNLSYKDRVLFDELEFVLEKGKWTSLMGISGIGKTTILRLIAGLASEFSSGTSIVHSRKISGELAYMSQVDLLFPWLNVLDNVTLGARLRGEECSKDRALELLRSVGLYANAADMPSSLSVGMRQRVALARTLMEDRPFILMDEPFSSLDSLTKVRLQDLAAEMLQDKTVLLVTHDPLEAYRLSDSIYVLSGQPACLDSTIKPAGAPPRMIENSEVLQGQAELLARLSKAEAP